MTLSEYCIIEGRRTAGFLLEEPGPGGAALGAHLAHLASARAASALAYARLARELDHHAGPEELEQACWAASEADRGLARTLGAPARRYGGRPVAPRRETVRVRSLAEIATDNIVEGCVRETYGAAVAGLRARAAADPELRAIMERIAAASAMRSALAFDLARWLHTVIDPIEAALVEDTLRHAVRRLAYELDVEPARELVERAGVPDRRTAIGLWCALGKTVWRTETERVWAASAA